MTGITEDLRYSLRTLARAPGLTIAAVLALSVSIGANTSIFSVVDRVLLRPLPYDEPDGLVTAWNTWEEKGFSQMAVVPSDFVEWRRQAEVLEGLAASKGVEFNLTGGGEAERIHGARVSWDLFRLLHVQPALGRGFLESEDRPGAERVAILSHGVWQRRFGGRREALDESIVLDGRLHRIAGVMPAGFRFSVEWKMTGLLTTPVEVWVPLALEQWEMNNGFELTVVGRLKPGIGLERARNDLETVGARIDAENPDHKGIGVRVVGLRDLLTRDVRPAVVALAVAVGLVLLIACANVANLLLAKASGRQREIAVRAALGAGRGRLARQLLVESLVLAAAAGLLGLFLASGLTSLLSSYAPAAVLRMGAIGMDLRVLAFTAGLSLLSAVVFGLAPMLHALGVNLNGALRNSARAGFEGRRQKSVRQILVVAEIALAVLLVVGSGLLVQSFYRVTAIDPGFRSSSLTMARVSLPAAAYASSGRRAAFFDEVVARLENVPGIEQVSVSSSAPLEQAREVFFRVEGRSVDGDVKAAPSAISWAVGPGYLQVMGIPLEKGRFLFDTDTRDSELVVVVDEQMARRHWPGEDPIGKRVREGYSGTSQPWMRVVGVVGSVRQHGLQAEVKPGMYVSHRQSPRREMTLIARARLEPAAIASAIRETVRDIDPNQPVAAVRTMDDVLAQSVAPRRFSTSLLTAFALLALLLAATGVYALMSYAVSRRTAEIGIRKALGAPSRSIVAQVLAEGLSLAGAGLAIGCVGAAWLTRLLSSELYGVKATDPATFAASCALLLAVAVAACLLPAYRANSVDPIVALRQE